MKELLIFRITVVVCLLLLFHSCYFHFQHFPSFRFYERLPKSNGSSDDLNFYSYIIQNELKELQSPQNCNLAKVSLHCGCNMKCGLGCQIHLRILCLIASYALKVPLIHDESNFFYTKPWNTIFEPLGSACSRGPNTFQMESVPSEWPIIYRGIPCSGPYPCKNSTNSTQIDYPLKLGIPLSKAMADKIERLHDNPFQWLLAQFFKFGLQPKPELIRKVDEAKALLKWDSPIVGLHVRRTDKFTEGLDSLHAFSEYMDVAEKHFQKFPPPSGVKRVFIASDAPQVIRGAKKLYNNTADYEILGFELDTRKNRSETLEETALDIFLLMECDFVVCGYSSSICRLVHEMSFLKKRNPAFEKVHPLDRYYSFGIQGIRLERSILKI